MFCLNLHHLFPVPHVLCITIKNGLVILDKYRSTIFIYVGSWLDILGFIDTNVTKPYMEVSDWLYQIKIHIPHIIHKNKKEKKSQAHSTIVQIIRMCRRVTAGRSIIHSRCSLCCRSQQLSPDNSTVGAGAGFDECVSTLSACTGRIEALLLLPGPGRRK